MSEEVKEMLEGQETELNETEVNEADEAVKEVNEAAAEPVQEKEETMEDFKDELEASFKKISEGDIMTGTVIGVTESSVILDLKYYTDGIIRLEDYSSDPSFNLKEDVHVGDEITATVIKRDDG